MIKYLIELQKSLDQEDVEFVIGGGLSLYIRQVYHYQTHSDRYPFIIQSRSTEDIDVFLNSDVIVDSKKINKLKAVLLKLGYAPSKKAQCFQFHRNLDFLGKSQTIKIDLLAAPPKDEDQDKVKINSPRIRPKECTQIHAFLTKEAICVDYGKIPVKISENNKSEIIQIFIPSAFNYLIFKLFAFNDRKDRSDLQSDFGRHHAFDIFATVCRMDENDWDNAKNHYRTFYNLEIIKNACDIRKKYFSDKFQVGSLRIRESENYKIQKKIFDQYYNDFLNDMKDLFP